MPAELVKTETQAIARPSEPSLMQIIQAVAENPQIDVSRLQALLEMKERLEARDAQTQFNAAMARLSPKLPRVAKNGKIEMGGKGAIAFARYDDVDAAIRPLEAAEGLTRSFSAEPHEKGVMLTCTIRHVAGHAEVMGKMLLPPDAGPGRNALQAIGSSHQYGRRYLTLDAYNIVTKDADDDGTSTDLISQDQADNIRALLSEIGGGPAREAKFLEFCGVKTIEDITKGAYKMAMRQLEFARRKG